MNKIAFLAAGLFATLGTAQAQAWPQTYLVLPAAPTLPPTRLMFGIGVSGGGDRLASAGYTNGDTVDIHAGGLAYLSAGIDYRVTPGFSLQGSINYHVDSADARNGEVRFERYPIELMAYVHPDPYWRVGAGARHVISPKLTGSGLAAGTDVSFANTTSPVIEAEYFVDYDMGIKLRYVHETYRAKGYRDIDGSHVGMSLNFYF